VLGAAVGTAVGTSLGAHDGATLVGAALEVGAAVSDSFAIMVP